MTTSNGKTNDKQTDRRIVMVLAFVITAAWATSFIVDIVDNSYDPPASVHALMMIVAGAVFGEGLLHTARKDNSNNGQDK